MAEMRGSILRVRGGAGDGTTISLTDGMTSIGRDVTNDIVVDEAAVSRRHAAIRGERGGYWIEDLGSRNGTYVNGDEVEGEGQQLRDQDRIELGGTVAVHWIFRELGATVSMRVPRRSG